MLIYIQARTLSQHVTRAKRIIKKKGKIIKSLYLSQPSCFVLLCFFNRHQRYLLFIALKYCFPSIMKFLSFSQVLLKFFSFLSINNVPYFLCSILQNLQHRFLTGCPMDPQGVHGVGRGSIGSPKITKAKQYTLLNLLNR